MKFEQKLINLRKQKSLSQEELAEKLNVTRQTISKWELGQSKPDMDKLLELSKLFNVGVEELTNDNIDLGKEKTKLKTEKKERKYILYILIVILIAAVATLVIRIGLEREEQQQKQNGFFTNIFGTVTDIVEDQMQNNGLNTNIDGTNIIDGIKDVYEENKDAMEDKVNKSQFNIGFTYAEGTKATIFVENILDKVVTSNKQNKDMLITVVYKETSTTDVDEIKNIKKSLEQWAVYEVSVDYDEAGYVNKITIEYGGMR